MSEIAAPMMAVTSNVIFGTTPTLRLALAFWHR